MAGERFMAADSLDSRETLNKAILAFSAHAAAQTRFAPCFKINGLQPPILASRPWLTGNAI